MGSGKTTAANMVAAILNNKFENNTTAFLIKFANPIYRTVGVLHIDGKPRSFMQKFGDLCRSEFGDDIFERVFEFEYNILIDDEIGKRKQEYIVILVDDLRFNGEYRLLKELGFTVVKINADEDVRRERLGGDRGTFINTQHRSELELNYIKGDINISNNGSFTDLHKKISQIIEEKR